MAIAALAHASISAVRATFQARVTISVASELRLFDQKFALDNDARAVAPVAVEEVTVAEPRISVASRRLPQYVINAESFALSAVEKPTAGPERAAHSLLAERFKQAMGETPAKTPEVSQAHPASHIVLADRNDPELEDEENERPMDHMALAAIFNPKIMVAKALTIHRRHATVAIQAPVEVVSAVKHEANAPAVAEVVASRQPQVQSLPKMPRPLVAFNEIQGPDRFDYSDVVQHFLGDAKPTKLESLVPAPSQVAKAAKEPIKPAAPPAAPIPVTKLASVQKTLDSATQAESQVDYVSAPPAVIHMNSRPAQSEPPAESAPAPATSPAVNNQVGTPAAPIDVRKYMSDSSTMSSQQGTPGPGAVVSLYQPTIVKPVAPSAPSAPPAPPANPAPSSPQQQAPTPTPTPTPTPNANRGGTFQMFGLDQTNATPPAAFSGQVLEAFTGGTRGVSGALVQVLGTELSTKTDDAGAFSFPNANVDGVLPIIISKDGYLKRRADLKPTQSQAIELVSENSVSLSALAAGESKAPQGSFLYGQLVSPNGESVDGLRIEITGATNFNPIYVDGNGIPNRALDMTSARGQFLALNVTPGTYLVSVTDPAGRERAPHIIYVGQNEGVVRKFSLGQPRFIRGKVANAAAANAPVDGAVVQFLGSQKTATTDSAGHFVLGPVYVDCASLNYLQMEKPGYYRNRIDYGCPGTDIESSFFVFPASYIDGNAGDIEKKFVPDTGIVLGHASFKKPVRMQLWGPEEMNLDSSGRGEDYYFNTDGVLSASRERTSSTGNFEIFDAPEGISYIQAFDQNNRTLSFWPVFTSANTVNVYAQ